MRANDVHIPKSKDYVEQKKIKIKIGSQASLYSCPTCYFAVCRHLDKLLTFSAFSFPSFEMGITVLFSRIITRIK